MTVKELIEHLSKLPDNMEVVWRTRYDNQWYSIHLPFVNPDGQCVLANDSWVDSGQDIDEYLLNKAAN